MLVTKHTSSYGGTLTWPENETLQTRWFKSNEMDEGSNPWADRKWLLFLSGRCWCLACGDLLILHDFYLLNNSFKIIFYSTVAWIVTTIFIKRQRISASLLTAKHLVAAPLLVMSYSGWNNSHYSFSRGICKISDLKSRQLHYHVSFFFCFFCFSLTSNDMNNWGGKILFLAVFRMKCPSGVTHCTAIASQ